MTGYRPGFIAVLAATVSMLAACAGAPLRTGEFQPYVDRFEQAARDNGLEFKVKRLVIEYGLTIPETAVASCYILPWEAPHIAVNRSIWETIDPACREIYLFHEMGHCVLHRLHPRKTAAGQEPMSLMNWNTLSCDTYLKHRAAYLKELFSK
jgi:hypothetical protein